MVLGCIMDPFWIHFGIQNRPRGPLGATRSIFKNLCFTKVNHTFRAWRAPGTARTTPGNDLEIRNVFVEVSTAKMTTKWPQNGSQKEYKSVKKSTSKSKRNSSVFKLFREPMCDWTCWACEPESVFFETSLQPSLPRRACQRDARCYLFALLWIALLCFALLCFASALLCLALLCFTLLRFAVLCFASLCFALLRFALLCFVLLCFASASLCFASLCFASLCFALLSFALLCLALLRLVLLCFGFASLCFASLHFALLCFAPLRFVLFCFASALLCFSLLCFTSLCFALLWFRLCVSSLWLCFGLFCFA